MARALATQPQLLLLDEVMAGLNPSEVDQAVALVGKLSQRGLTIVIVEHVMRAIMAVAKHIVVLDHGQKIAEGNPKEIVDNPEVIRAYLGSYAHAPSREPRHDRTIAASARLTGRSRRSPTSPSMSAKAKRSACSAPTAPARARRCARFRAGAS